MSTAEHPAALARRIEQLAADSADEPDPVAALATALRSELEDGSAAVESRLAVLEDVLDGLNERIEALARDGARTTTDRLEDLSTAVRRLDERVQGELAAAREAAAADREAVARLGEAVGALGDRVSSRLSEVGQVHGRLVEVVQAMRAEWPTRTYEVVEGARAVAEGVVREVRAEVQAQLRLVQAELARAADALGGAGTEDRTAAPVAPADPVDPADPGDPPALAPPSTARGSLAEPVPAARRPARTVAPAPPRRSAGDRRGRLDTMPEVPSVQVALDAAAPPAGERSGVGGGADETDQIGRTDPS